MKKTKISLLVIFTITVMTFLTACFHDEETTPSSAASIRTADVTLTSPIPLSETEFELALYDIEEFNHNDDDYDFFDDSATADDEFEKCLADNFGNTKFVVGTTQGVRLDADFNDARNCFPTEFAELGLDSVNLSILLDNMILTDQNGNIVTVAGDTMSSASNLKVKEGNLRMWFEIKASFSDGQESYFFNISVAYSQNHVNGIDLPCLYESPLNNCRAASVFTTSTNIPNISSGQDGYLVVANNIYFTDGQPYYYDGTIHFTVNDWTGEMQYGSTGNTNPTYTATNGSLTSSGTFTGIASPKPSKRLKAGETLIVPAGGNLQSVIQKIVKQNVDRVNKKLSR